VRIVRLGPGHCRAGRSVQEIAAADKCPVQVKALALATAVGHPAREGPPWPAQRRLGCLVGRAGVFRLTIRLRLRVAREEVSACMQRRVSMGRTSEDSRGWEPEHVGLARAELGVEGEVRELRQDRSAGG
jgi:hypothetical protein